MSAMVYNNRFKINNTKSLVYISRQDKNVDKRNSPSSLFRLPHNMPHPTDMFKVTERPWLTRVTPSQFAEICLVDVQEQAI